ncbi:hypothetical protein LSUE1_G007129 [Lachnellula suecica]|uniref:Uncharacterized protein n=1 Tax=Lachnellula suecica TaxID=602035 RepID=A0A8T9C7R1_9HELO|nr:hypothetical protein LSUE1_G007129 [Lachnellula suecica]
MDAQQSETTTTAGRNYPELVRKAGVETLTTERVFAAFGSVILERPALSIVGVNLPSEETKENRRLWGARLPSISFQDCAEFLDDQPDGDEALSTLFGRYHNPTSGSILGTKASRGGRLLLQMGSMLLSSLLAALNEPEASPPPTVTSITTLATDLSKALPPSPLDQIQDTLMAACHQPSHPVVPHSGFFDHKHFLFSDAVFPNAFPTAAKPLPITERTVTKTQTSRIKKDHMKRCLNACHQHNTTFKALFHTLIQITLATDFYPEANIGFSRLAVNIRPWLRTNPGRDAFTNAASQYARKQCLDMYHAAGNASSSEQNTAANYQINAPLAWRLAARYKAHLSNFCKSRKPLQDFLTGKLLGEDNEKFIFYGLGLYQNNGFLILNLGSFEPKGGMAKGGWSIADVGFSAREIRATLGDTGIVFKLSSVKNGDRLIVAMHEEGVLRDGMVREVLAAIMARLEFLLLLGSDLDFLLSG